MGSGLHGGFGRTKGSDSNNVSLPKNRSQTKHIFRDKEGHLPDTPENRELLRELANDKSKFKGVDKWGNSWNIRNNEDGTQDWVRYQNGVINEGGRNLIPLPWDPDTRLNYNPHSVPAPTPNISPTSNIYYNPFITEEGYLS